MKNSDSDHWSCCLGNLFSIRKKTPQTVLKDYSSLASVGSERKPAEDLARGRPGPDTLNTTLSGRRSRTESPQTSEVRGSPKHKRQNSMEREDEISLGSPSNTTKASDEGSGQLSQRTSVPSFRSNTFPKDRRENSGKPSTDLDSAASSQKLKLCPPYGSKSVIGRRAKMEDACVVVPNLLKLPITIEFAELMPPRIEAQLRSTSGSDRTSVAVDISDCLSSPRTREPTQVIKEETLHFFGVFDGHGGADAALHCAKTLHERVRDVLRDAAIKPLASEGLSSPPLSAYKEGGQGESIMDESGVKERTNSNSDESNMSGIVDPDAVEEDVDNVSKFSMLANAISTPEAVEAALARAFFMTDEEFGAMGGYDQLALVGTTAVVALVGEQMIYVANCGDSRAVLCRDGIAVPLTDDHKAAREDETARVEAAGGQILFWNGVRVMGLLAVSRAIGDHSLRPYVIAEPEVTIVNRAHGADELLIMASDGLWDVMNNQDACTLAKKCLGRARQRGSSRSSAARVAATVLTRAAVDRGSRDNVTVVIVDLSPPTVDELGMTKFSSEEHILVPTTGSFTKELHQGSPAAGNTREESSSSGIATQERIGEAEQGKRRHAEQEEGGAVQSLVDEEKEDIEENSDQTQQPLQQRMPLTSPFQ